MSFWLQHLPVLPIVTPLVAGAAMLLLSGEELKKSEKLSRECDVVELSTNPFFMDEYVESMAVENSNA